MKRADLERFGVTIYRPGDAGFDELAKLYPPPEHVAPEPPRPLFYDRHDTTASKL